MLIGPNGERIAIDRRRHRIRAISHFKAYHERPRRNERGEFKPLDVINEYDVGIIHPEARCPSIDTGGARHARARHGRRCRQAQAWRPGRLRRLSHRGHDGDSWWSTDAPATLHFGNISSLTDVFMCRAEPEHQLLIQHTRSGHRRHERQSADRHERQGDRHRQRRQYRQACQRGHGHQGKAGSDDAAKPRTARAEGAASRTRRWSISPSASICSTTCARRRGRSGNCRRSGLLGRKPPRNSINYFDERGQRLRRALAGRTLRRGGRQEEDVRQRHARSRAAPVGPHSTRGIASYELESLPGHVYGFIADSKSGIPVALNVKKQGDVGVPARQEGPAREPDRCRRRRRSRRRRWVTVDKPTKSTSTCSSMIAAAGRLRALCL